MQPGSRNLTGELNTVEDVVGDERCLMPAMWGHKQRYSVLTASLVVMASVDGFEAIDVNNIMSHARSVWEATV